MKQENSVAKLGISAVYGGEEVNTTRSDSLPPSIALPGTCPITTPTDSGGAGIALA